MAPTPDTAQAFSGGGVQAAFAARRSAPTAGGAGGWRAHVPGKAAGARGACSRARPSPRHSSATCGGRRRTAPRSASRTPAARPARCGGGRRGAGWPPCLAAQRPGHDVVELQPVRRAAAAAPVERPGAAAAVALPDGAADGGGDGFAGAGAAVGRRLRGGRRSWPASGRSRGRAWAGDCALASGRACAGAGASAMGCSRADAAADPATPAAASPARAPWPASPAAGRAPPRAPAPWWRPGWRGRARPGRPRASAGTAG